MILKGFVLYDVKKISAKKLITSHVHTDNEYETTYSINICKHHFTHTLEHLERIFPLSIINTKYHNHL
jgi:hypothetical protein